METLSLCSLKVRVSSDNTCSKKLCLETYEFRIIPLISHGWCCDFALCQRGVQCVLLRETTWYCLFWLRVPATQFNSVQSTSIRIMLTFLFYRLKSSHTYGKGLISLFFYSVLSKWNAKGKLNKWKLDYDHKSLPCMANTRERMEDEKDEYLSKMRQVKI